MTSLLAFYDFPAEHWVHLRTTNPIESTFSTVKLRTKVTRGAGSPAAALAMVFKLVEAAQARWRAITGSHLVPLVRAGARFENGILVERTETRAAWSWGGRRDVATCFMLVVNFGDDAEAAQAAARIDPKPWVLRAGAHRIPLHPPMLAKVGSYIELSILPVAVSWGCGLDGSLPRFQLTAAELTELGHQLYELLAQFHGYVAAKVGWDPESLLDPAELRCEWSDELNDGSIHGLVLCEKLHAELDPSTDYEVFQPGYRWIPYRGEEPSNLAAD